MTYSVTGHSSEVLIEPRPRPRSIWLCGTLHFSAPHLPLQELIGTSSRTRPDAVILDVRDVGTDPPPVDLCIVGGGPAGLTLAAALSHTGMQILLLEGGSHQTNGATQELYRGEVTGNHPSAHEYRVRALGGSSKTWGGGCVPLDP